MTRRRYLSAGVASTLWAPILPCSSAAFSIVPTPGSLAIFGIAGICAIRRKR
jgi:hypothetical protein